jgi:hypothetical protein
MSDLRCWAGRVWALGAIALALLVAARFDLATWWRTVALPDGSLLRMPVGWATVDHPFHVARAETLRRALLDGEVLRWFGQHHGGYPAEFYPTGVAWLETALWVLLFGQAPMEAVHRIAIGTITVAPLAAFWWWARRDRLTPGVALFAGAAQILVAGYWWSGGWTELALWGLVTNVAAQTATLFVLGGLVAWLRDGSRGALVVAVVATGFAVGSNPRSALGIAVVGLAAFVATALAADPGARGWQRLVGRGAAFAGLAGLACAPELVALARYQDLYYFVHYTGYDGVRAWLDGTLLATPRPFALLAIAGVVGGLRLPGRPTTRAAAIAAVLYGGGVAALALSGAAFAQQLELTRLMPLQRLLVFYLAGVGLHDLVVALARLARQTRPQLRGAGALAVATALVVAVYGFGAFGWAPVEERGAQAAPSSARPSIGELEVAVRRADAEAPAGTALLVLGTVVSWHDGLWAPMWSERPFYYDDWLWYWQRDHQGAYNPDSEHAYPDDRTALDPAYLAAHGIGAVVVTGDARQAAAGSPALVAVTRGQWWDVYRVAAPTTIVTVDGAAPASIAIDALALTASGEGDGGVALVRRNWFPRWRAEVNGAPAAITKTDGGYMAIEVPPGAYTLRLTYALDWLDWAARVAFAAAALACVALVGDSLRRTWRRGEDDSSPRAHDAGSAAG